MKLIRDYDLHSHQVHNLSLDHISIKRIGVKDFFVTPLLGKLRAKCTACPVNILIKPKQKNREERWI